MNIYEEYKHLIDKKEISEDESASLVHELEELYDDLDVDTEERISKYRTYADYFNDIQWEHTEKMRQRDEDRHRYTKNLCRPTVEKYGSLLASNDFRFYVPGLYESQVKQDAAGFFQFGEETPEFGPEENRSEILEKKLNRILFTDNDFGRVSLEAANGGSLYGDSIFYLSFDKPKNTFLIQTIFPGHFRAKFSEADFSKMDYVFLQHVMTLKQIKRVFGVEVEDESGDILDMPNVVWNPFEKGQNDWAVVKTYFDDKIKISYVGNHILKVKKNKRGRIPFWHIPNRVNSFRPWGISDLASLLEIQDRVNLAISNQADIIELYANPKLLAKGLNDEEINSLVSNQGNLINVRAESDIAPIEFKGNVFPIQQELADAMRSYHEVSELPEILFGQSTGSIVTGTALSAQAAPTLNRINAKLKVWTGQLKSMCAFMLETLEKEGGKIEDDILPDNERMTYKDVIAGVYEVRVKNDARLPRDDSIFQQNQVNLVNFGLQSKLRAMEQLGIESPDDELKRIAFEQSHPLYNPEGAKAVADLRVPEASEEIAKDAFDENIRMLQGEEVPAEAEDAEAHLLHNAIHEQFVRDNEDMPEPIRLIFDQHMADHDAQAKNQPKTPRTPKLGEEASLGETAFPTRTADTADIPNPTLPPGGAGESIPLPQAAPTPGLE